MLLLLLPLAECLLIFDSFLPASHVFQAGYELWYTAEYGLKLLILVLLPPVWWDYRYVPPYLMYVMLGIKPMVLYMLGKHSTN